MKKLLAIVLSLCLCFAFNVPLAAFAEDPDPGQGDTGQAGEQTQAFDPYASFELLACNDAGKLTVPANVEVLATPKQGRGLFMKFKKTYAGERFAIDEEFSFDNAPVGRFMFDGLTERNKDVTVHFYLDEEPDPFVSFKLGSIYGKVEWAPNGDQIKVLANALSDGPHRVSFSLDTGGSGVEVLLRSFLFMQDTGLPTLEFDIDESRGTIEAMNYSEDHSRECYGDMRVYVPKGYEYEYGTPGTVANTATVESYKLEYLRGRGNSTWSNGKKPYKVKLHQKNELLGMGANKHWVLLANRYDPSLLRNKITYWMGDQLGMQFTPKCVFVDVIMNGVYYGSYYLCEQIRVGESRVNIADLEEENPYATTGSAITGGYLLNMDYGADDDVAIDTSHGAHFCIESPSYDDLKNQAKSGRTQEERERAEQALNAQVGYITNYVNKLDTAVYGEGFKDAEGKGYETYLNVDAAIDYYWMQMMTMNGDAYDTGSTYLFKDREDTENSRITWGPLWDFDYVAWGDLEYDDYTVEGFDTSAPWLGKLLQDEGFAEKMRTRWNKIKELLLEITRQGGKLDQYAAQLAVSQRYDDAKWGRYGESGGDLEYGEKASMNNYGEPNSPYGGDDSSTVRTYADEIAQLRGWIQQRVKWIDENVNDLKSVSTTLTFKDRGKVVETRDVMVGDEIGYLPAPPTRKGYLFEGWFYTDSEGEEYELSSYSSVFDENMVAVARWIKESDAVKPKVIAFLCDEANVMIGSSEYGYDDEETFMMPYDIAPSDALRSSILWSSSDPKLASVDSSGLVTMHKTGSVVITASCPGGPKASYKLNLFNYDAEMDYAENVMLNTEELAVVVDDTGKIDASLEPSPCVFRPVTWRSLDPGVADVGESGLVTGISPGTTHIMASLDGSDDYVFCKVTVLPNDVSAAKVTLKKKSAVYNGKKKKPQVKSVKLNGKKLRKGKDYTVKLPKKCKNAGVYTVKVVGKGVMVGSAKATFKVLPPKAKLAKPKAKKNKIRVKVKKLSKSKLKQVSGYQVRWSTSKKFTNFKTMGVSVKKKRAKATLTKIKAGKRHYIQVRTYKKVKGKKLYSPWSKKVSVK